MGQRRQGCAEFPMHPIEEAIREQEVEQACAVPAPAVATETLYKFVAFLEAERERTAKQLPQSEQTIGYSNGLYVAALNLRALLPPPPKESR